MEPGVLPPAVVAGSRTNKFGERCPLSISNAGLKTNWGRCLILMDGLDEAGDAEVRIRVVDWVERQMRISLKEPIRAHFAPARL